MADTHQPGRCLRFALVQLDCLPLGGCGALRSLSVAGETASITSRELAARSDRAGFPASAKMTENRRLFQRNFLKVVSIVFLPRLEYARLEYRAKWVNQISRRIFRAVAHHCVHNAGVS